MDLRDITDNVHQRHQSNQQQTSQQEHTTDNVKREVEHTKGPSMPGRSAQQTPFSELTGQLQQQQDTQKQPENISPRTYLDSTVVPTLLEGLKRVVLERPSDPLAYLGRYLLDCSANLKAESKNTMRPPQSQGGAPTTATTATSLSLHSSPSSFVKKESQS
ncbi:hypothetical protein BDC45DRAFT_103704 [Circinella umbellata]|nr:hypothetical protein BDC45DRAFT_103704 [Circinella umbellata]